MLLFSAFLLLPILVFLDSLLFLVTRVLETISPLPLSLLYYVLVLIASAKYILKIKISFFNWTNIRLLLAQGLSVKILSSLYLIIYIFSSSVSFALTDNQEVINLAKGEIREVSWPPLTRYTIGNKEIVSVKVSKNKVLIKGKHLGLSDVILWGKYNQRRQIQVNIIDKRSHQKIYRMASHLKKLDLQVEVLDKTLVLKGTLSKKRNYQTLIRYIQEAKKTKINIYFNDLLISKELKRSNFAHFLRMIMELNLTMLDCSPKGVSIDCQEMDHPELVASKKYLDKNFLINWIPQQGTRAMKQFQVDLILQQFENQTGKSFSLGLNRLAANWEQILSDSPLSLIKQNKIHIEDSHFKTSTLARPNIVGRFNAPIKIKIGQEILFMQSLGTSLATQQWKFAGLDINITLSPMAEGILINYKNSLSQPSGDSIARSSQSSSIIVEENESKILFDIGFLMKKKDQSSFPGLSSIPLFGSLFKNNFSSTSYKKILCIIKIKEIAI